MGLALGLLPVLLTFGAINALVPLLIIIILIAAAASLTRGWNAMKIFGIDFMAGIAGAAGNKGTFRGKSAFTGGRTPGRGYRNVIAGAGAAKAAAKTATQMRANTLQEKANVEREAAQKLRGSGTGANEHDSLAQKYETRAEAYRRMSTMAGLDPMEKLKDWKDAGRLAKEKAALAKNLENLDQYPTGGLGQLLGTPANIRELQGAEEQITKLVGKQLDSFDKRFFRTDIAEGIRQDILDREVAKSGIVPLVGATVLLNAAAKAERNEISNLVDQYYNRTGAFSNENLMRGAKERTANLHTAFGNYTAADANSE